MQQPLPPLAAPQRALRDLAVAVRASGYRFITVTPATHALVNARPENRLARRLEDVFGWSRPFRRDLLPADMLTLMREAEVVAEGPEECRSRVRFSSLGPGLIAHSAFPTTARDAVFFGPDTYKFVQAVELWLGMHASRVRRAADICSGAGPAALTIARACPEASVLMVDINEAALCIAEVNASLAGLANTAARRSDMLSAVEGDFDLIVAHPPYLVDAGARAYRHGGGPLGAGLSLAVVRAAVERLAPGGTLLLFTGVAMVDNEDPFRRAVTSLLPEAAFDWSYREVDPDVFGEELARPPYDRVDRLALVVLTATRRG